MIGIAITFETLPPGFSQSWSLCYDSGFEGKSSCNSSRTIIAAALQSPGKIQDDYFHIFSIDFLILENILTSACETISSKVKGSFMGIYL